MKAVSLGATRAEEVIRVVRALGAHRYVAGRLHLVHALAAEAIAGEVARWARAVIEDASVDKASRDERLWRRCSEAEVAAVLEAFWLGGAGDRLMERLASYQIAMGGHEPFDESAEDEMHPVLIDAGWELLPLGKLDAQKHAGAIGAFGEAIAFESAKFEEETAIPAVMHLYELPAMGAVELLRGVDGGGALIAAPLVVWAQGNETYVDYVMRGVRRAAKLAENG